MVRDLMTIEGARRVVDWLPLPPDVDLRLRQEARIRSTHHSTKIEGNQLSQEAVPQAVAHPERQGQHEAEVRNYWKALEWLELCMDDGAAVSESLIRELHRTIMPTDRGGRQPRRSNYRTQEVGVIDSRTRSYEYMAPKPDDVPVLMADLTGWIVSQRGGTLPGPVRAAILAYQFVTIHPFMDGNGRTARALATLELWRSGYWMEGFLSMEEYYTRDQEAYYAHLQMGLPADYYEGRHDPDLTPWISYFVDIMADAADALCKRAESFSEKPTPPLWTRLSRPQQQLLSRCMVLVAERDEPVTFSPADMTEWFEVSRKTVHEWLADWKAAGFVSPASEKARVRNWKLGPQWEDLIRKASK